MAIKNRKFTEEKFISHRIIDLSDTPSSDGMTAADLKAYFDFIPKTMIALQAINGLIDDLTASTGAGEIGASVGGVQGTVVAEILTTFKTAIDNTYTQAVINGFLDLKSDKSVTDRHIKNIQLIPDTGTLRFQREDNTYIDIDTDLEKVVTNFTYDSSTQSLKLRYPDGSEVSIPLSEFITNLEIKSSSTIEVSRNQDGSVALSIKPGAITDELLSSNMINLIASYVASCESYASNALANMETARMYADQTQANASSAASSKISAENNANIAKSYAVGNTGRRPGEDTDNSKYYSEQAKVSEAQAKQAAMEARAAANVAVGFDYLGAWSSTQSYTQGQLVSYNATVWTATKNNINSIPYEGSSDWIVFVGLPPILDLGDFDTEISNHMFAPYAHGNMVIDGNNGEATTQSTLLAHEGAPDAHGNIIIDGGN